MASTDEVKNYLLDNQDKLIELLKKMKYHNIVVNRNEIRCSYEPNSNPTGVRIDLKTLKAIIYTKDIYGDIYNLIQFKTNRSFKEIHQVLCKYCGLDQKTVPTVKKKFFGGFFLNNKGFEEDKIYEESILLKYEDIPSYRFYLDGISGSTQRRFGIRYDSTTKRIVIPWRNTLGELVGTTGRYNYEIINESVPKYLTLEKFRKGNFLFGIHDELIRKEIVKKNEVIIVESEKSVLKAFQMGVFNCVAVGSHSISDRQCKVMKEFCTNVVIAFDEDVSDESLSNTCTQLSKDFEVSYIVDIERKFMRHFSKLSPLDLSKEEFLELYNNRIIF